MALFLLFNIVNVAGEEMLSFTYVQTALKVEQDRVRSRLGSFRQYLHDKYRESAGFDRNVLEQLLHKIKRVHLNCSWRRLETHVLPEIREATQSADSLLAEVESMRLLGLGLYRYSRDRLRKAIEGESTDKKELYQGMEMYCQTVQGLLAIEEQELLGIAFESIPEARWFSIAERFMQLDKNMLECGDMGEVAHKRRTEQQPESSLIAEPGVESPLSITAQPEARAESPLGENTGYHPYRCSAGEHGKISAQGVYHVR